MRSIQLPIEELTTYKITGAAKFFGSVLRVAEQPNTQHRHEPYPPVSKEPRPLVDKASARLGGGAVPAHDAAERRGRTAPQRRTPRPGDRGAW